MKEYRILLVEDIPAEVNQVKREIGKVLENFQVNVVDTRYDFVDQMETFNPDLVIANYKFPSFSGLAVLKLVQEKPAFTPVIILSNAVNEETAVECMKAGATDYINREHLKKLGKAVVGALELKEKRTEIVRVEQAPVPDAETYHYMFANNPQPMYMLDLETLAFLEVNKAAVEKYGYSEEEFLSMTLKNICPVEDIPAGRKEDEMRPQCYTSGNWWHLKKTGEIMHVEISSIPIEYKGRRARNVQVADVTERKKVLEALTRSEQKYRSLFEDVQDVFFQTDLEGILYEISPSVDRYLGYSREELIGNPVNELYCDIREREQMLKILVLNHEIRDFNTRFKTRYDEIIHASINARLLCNSAGKPDLIEGSIRDITERVEAEENLRRREEKFHKLFENHSAVKIVFDPETQQIVEANHAATRFYGYSSDELRQMKVGDTNVATEEELTTLIEKIITLGKLHFETRHRSNDGSLKDVEVFASKITISGKDWLYTIVHDITARKQEEQLMRLLGKAMERSSVGVMITDPEGGIEYVNPKFTRITGYRLDEIKGKNQWFLYSGKHSGETYHEMWETVLSGKEWNGEYPVKRKNGESYWANVNITPVVNEKRQITHVVAMSEEITEKHNSLEALLASKEKAESTDKLKSAFISNISSEVRTPLNGILGFAEILVNEDFSKENKLNFIDIIKKSSTRLLNTVTSYNDISMIVSGNTKAFKKKFHLNSILNELKDEYSETCSSRGITLTVRHTDGPEDIQMYTDPDILGKILHYLLDNAVKYTLQGSIDFGFRKRNDIPGFYVTDTGIGIEKEKIKSIFDYTQQLDSLAAGGYAISGLGLPIARGMAQILGGEMFVESQKDKGSTFYFTLPADVVVTTVTKEEVKTKQQPLPATPIILVAEDDDYNYKFIETVLNRVNFKVVRAINGAEAVNFCYNNPEVNLVLMDLKMPVLGGIEATRKIKDFLPRLPVIALTAYVSSENEQEAFLSGCDEYIKKPVDRVHLLASISNILGNKVN